MFSTQQIVTTDKVVYRYLIFIQMVKGLSLLRMILGIECRMFSCYNAYVTNLNLLFCDTGIAPYKYIMITLSSRN